MPSSFGPPHAPRFLIHRWPTVPRDRLLVLVAVVLIVTFRSALFVFEEQLDFDSDQAIIGLAAKHLSEARAFPLFFYGQNYMLAVEAWMAAPLFWLFGASVATLKLPLLVINVSVGLLLVTLFEKELGLSPVLGLIASAFFLLPPPGSSAALLETTGGNVEPFLYVALLWLTRRRPVWFGLLFGLGFLQREFTLYGLIALLVMEAADGSWRRRDDWRRLLSAARVAAEVWLVVQSLRFVASAAGPGTSMADLVGAPSTNLIEVMNRFCFDPRTLAAGLKGLVTVHWPQLFGTPVMSASAFGLESATTQGFPGSGIALGIAATAAVARVAWLLRESGDYRGNRVGLYFILVGLLSAGVFALGRCGFISALRYDLLSLIAATGLAACFFRVETDRRLRGLGVVVIVAWAAMSAVAHGRIWNEYVFHRPPVSAKTALVRHLNARGVSYAYSDYWIAYYVTFVTNERIIVAADGFARIAEYGYRVNDHRSEAIRISRTPCGDGRPVFDGVYFCALE